MYSRGPLNPLNISRRKNQEEGMNARVVYRWQRPALIAMHKTLPSRFLCSSWIPMSS